jgi:hypothetical protein
MQYPRYSKPSSTIYLEICVSEQIVKSFGLFEDAVEYASPGRYTVQVELENLKEGQDYEISCLGNEPDNLEYLFYKGCDIAPYITQEAFKALCEYTKAINEYEQ